MAYKTKLQGASGSFGDMMSQGFGIVTVMNAYVCDALNTEDYKVLNPYDFANADIKADSVGSKIAIGGKQVEVLCRLDTLKVANVTQEGPSKTVTGGQYSNPLIKFGKSARLEMQDALGRAAAIEALCGGIVERNDNEVKGLHFGENFAGPKLIIGDSFFIDAKKGQQVPVKIVFYQFLPDSIFNLTQDAEGDATVFDMNGDLLTTVVTIGDEKGNKLQYGLFYSIVDMSGNPEYLEDNQNEEEVEPVYIEATDLPYSNDYVNIASSGENWSVTNINPALYDVNKTTLTPGDQLIVTDKEGKVVFIGIYSAE